MYSNLRAEMARQSLSLVDLSKMTGIKYQTLANKISGKQPMSLRDAKTIKSALGVEIPIDELFEVKV